MVSCEVYRQKAFDAGAIPLNANLAAESESHRSTISSLRSDVEQSIANRVEPGVLQAKLDEAQEGLSLLTKSMKGFDAIHRIHYAKQK